jgi:alpha-beta hydrolase superfamily lysophospholipase
MIEDLDAFVVDTEHVVARAREAHPGLPLVLIGHSLGGIVATRYGQKHGDELAALVLSGPAIGGNPDILGLVQLPEIPEIPVDPAILSRDPEVGRAYADDPLVYHGPFRRATLEALVAAVDRVAQGGSLGEVPTLWIHGEEDPLAPLAQAREAIARVRGSDLQEIVYPGARHEIFNETNKEEVIGDMTRFVDEALARSATSANAR